MYNDDGVRAERTGQRCPKISERHRHWGFNCPAVDIDFLMVEYDHGRPVAIVEYKEINWNPSNTSNMTYKAIRELAGELPFLVAVYDPNDWVFIVYPMNDAAERHYGDWAKIRISEKDFVESLYAFRKSELNAKDREAIDRLENSV